jgi:hypothetical protein
MLHTHGSSLFAVLRLKVFKPLGYGRPNFFRFDKWGNDVFDLHLIFFKVGLVERFVFIRLDIMICKVFLKQVLKIKSFIVIFTLGK